MKRAVQSSSQGVRQDKWSGTKLSKLTPFNPWFSIADSRKKQLEKMVEKEPLHPVIVVEEAAPGFIIPCTINDIQNTLSTIPPVFVNGLKAIIL